MSIGFSQVESEVITRPEPTLPDPTLPEPALCSRCQSAMSGPSSFPAVSLTPQELGVLRLYASGTTMYSVARELGIAPSSVATYIKRIRKKYANVGIHLSSKVDLNRVAREVGLID